MEGTVYRFTPSQLTGINVNLPGTGLTTVTAIVLNQQNAGDHPVIGLPFGLHGPGDVLARAPIVTLSRGPGQPGFYLDRDGTYTLNNVASDGNLW